MIRRSQVMQTITTAILLLLIIGMTPAWPRPAAVTPNSGRIVRMQECRTYQDGSADDAQVLQAFEHPEESVIKDLGALCPFRQRCARARKTLRAANCSLTHSNTRPALGFTPEHCS